ncbi:hypothetical protein B0H14DRAFT_3672059, partial [Mycena olivaceomarginata]
CSRNSLEKGPATYPLAVSTLPPQASPTTTAATPSYLIRLFSKPELSATLAQAEAFSPWEIAQVNAGGTGRSPTPRIAMASASSTTRSSCRKRSSRKCAHTSATLRRSSRLYMSTATRRCRSGRMVRLNERLRFLRYPEGGFFRKHVDGHYEKRGEWAADLLHASILPSV